MLNKLLMLAAGTAFLALGVAEASRAASLEVFASGLDNPRGLAFGPNGDLYVTEAGRGGTGPCIPAPAQPPGTNLCYGASSAVTLIQNGNQQRVVTGLPSLALADGSDATGAQDIGFDSTGRAYVLVGLGTTAARRDSELGIPDFGHLLAIDNFNGGSSWTRVADVARYEDLNNPVGTIVDSNPYALLIQGNNALVVDAGGNDLLNVALAGSNNGSNITTRAVFNEQRTATNPFTNQPIPYEAVPTSIAAGSNNNLYIGQLTGFPFPEDAARVYQIGSDNQPQPFLTGFTNIIDLASDNNGGLYVLEHDANSLLSPGSTGALIYVASDGTRTDIIANDPRLNAPTGLALGSDGAIYVSNNGDAAGSGEILRVSDITPVPEPASTLGLLAVGGLFGVSQLKRKRK